MGNHHSHKSQGNGSHKSKGEGVKGNVVKATNGNGNGEGGGSGSFKNALSRKFSITSSSSAKEEPHVTILPPVEKLAKFLAERSHVEENVNGITQTVFTKYLFPTYTILSERLYKYLLKLAHSKNNYLSTNAFKQQCEKYLSVLDDEKVLDGMVRMFGNSNGEGSGDDEDEGGEVITAESMTSLLMCAYHVSMDHYSEGPQMCLNISKTLKAVVDSCFHVKNQLSCQFVSHWLLHNCPRLLLPLHRYVVHVLATSYRTLEDTGSSHPHLAAGFSADSVDRGGLELTTPVLEQPPPVSGEGKKTRHHLMLNMSMSWLLAGALPAVYSRPQRAHSPKNSGIGLASAAFLTKLLCAIPSHWLILYESNEQGLGANRFLHHVIGYKGPTLCLLKAEGGHVFCIASTLEYRESHHYWGGEDSVVFQLLPKFLILEKGAKILYFNLSVRGYPLGLRAGKDPRAPIIIVDGGFEKMEFSKIPYALEAIEVWGCGDPVSRETQLEIKKWEVKEAERQRCVKMSAADWLDHPDRYLLELAGRPQYHQNQNQN